MLTLTASETRANLYRLLDQAAESHQAIVVAGKRESIKQGMAESPDSCVKELDW